MRAREFKQFKEIISTCKDDDPIWWAGYLFIDLTEKQFRETREILRERYGVVIDHMGKPAVMTPPSGFCLRVE